MGRKRIRIAGETTTTKVNAEMLRRARMIAHYRQITLYDFLDAILQTAVDRDYARMLRDMTKQAESKSK